MKKETLEEWLRQVDSTVATLDKAHYAHGLNPTEEQVRASLKNASLTLEEAIKLRQGQGIRIPTGHSVSSALRPR